MSDPQILELTSKLKAYAVHADEDAKLFVETHHITDRNTLLNKITAIVDITKDIINAIICADPALQHEMEQWEQWEQSYLTKKYGDQ